MKYLQLVIFLFLFVWNTYAQQNTWVRTINYNPPPIYRHDSTLVGPMQVAPTPDGHFYVLNYDNEEGDQSVCYFNSNGTFTSYGVGGYGTLHSTRASGLMPTPDTGCVFIEYFDDWGSSSAYQSYTLKKFKGTGGPYTIHTWPINMGVGDIMTSAVPNYHNSYYCLINNSVWIDLASGDTFNFDNCKKIFRNDDFLFANSTFSRVDLNGNIVWSIPSDSYYIAGSSENVIYAFKDSLRKYEALTGNLLWTKPLPISLFGTQNTQFNEGLAVFNGRTISVIDSSGNLLNQNTIAFTHFNPSCYGVTSDKSIITGGSFISGDHYFNNLADTSYSPIVIKLDSLAHGVVDSTSYFYLGNTDNDFSEDFCDDAVVVAAAFGNTNGHPDLNGPQNFRNVVYAADWASSFPSGINYKYTDTNFDGVIDSQDIMGFWGGSALNWIGHGI
jgi:hypothetical protein